MDYKKKFDLSGFFLFLLIILFLGISTSHSLMLSGIAFFLLIVLVPLYIRARGKYLARRQRELMDDVVTLKQSLSKKSESDRLFSYMEENDEH